ncbi:MAG: molybdate ABC transporter substrate-binding protein [Alphaproteobacteria bacterium]|uniref:Molybdate ABC transporter substrate-binding protein n=1 Tax=Candidatus Nitrobium versatile TaxID=2884831 RepID=A0A953JB91_9BACT|nr:molybdate ABC transporter substrate-binding protein [Candidatus Nitrobium versatile]
MLASLVTLFSFHSHALSAEPSGKIVVSAAVSLKNAFEEIGKIFETKNRVLVLFNFGASGDLARQIGGGAPVDVFASAARKDMDEIERQGLVLPGSRADFAANTVVLVAPAHEKNSPRSFGDLRTERVQRIAVGNPKSVPAGRYAEEVFTYYKIRSALDGKLVYAENVRQVLDYVARGEVDAGVVYATDVVARAKEIKTAATAPEESHSPVVYPVAVIKGTRNEKMAKEFLALVMSPEGRRVLEKYGFRMAGRGK